MKTTDEEPVERLLRETRVLNRRILVTLAAILILSIYLLQRAFTDLASAGPKVLAWSSGYQFSVAGLRFSYVTMTLTWPVVLALFCFLCRIFISRKLVLLDFLTTEWTATDDHEAYFSTDSLFGRELRQPFARYVWAAIAVVPAVVTTLHLLGGVTNMVLLQRQQPSSPDLWPTHWAVAAIAILALSSAVGIWLAMHLLRPMKHLRDALVACSHPRQERAPSHKVDSGCKIDVNLASPETKLHPDKWEIFISAKKLERDGRMAMDNVIAEELYEYLEAEGYQVFFSSRSLEVLGASAYKMAIDRALDQCVVLIAVGASSANLDSGWVRYEWDSFLNDILSGIKPDGRIFVYVQGVSVKQLPRPLRQSQSFEHGTEGIKRLSNFIHNALPNKSTH